MSPCGQVSLGGQRYGLGRTWAGQTVSIRFDPEQRQVVLTQVRPQTRRGKRQSKLVPVRLDAKGLSVQKITGMPAPLEDLPILTMLTWLDNDSM